MFNMSSTTLWRVTRREGDNDMNLPQTLLR